MCVSIWGRFDRLNARSWRCAILSHRPGADARRRFSRRTLQGRFPPARLLQEEKGASTCFGYKGGDVCNREIATIVR